ncbi:MAG: type II toxin-antitoxin system prevent-host-death family antitoxin [Proteobacteria bacterium]|nr:type II toxin-antitoxin system prevent-host-death family antitoxin [Pseudomonadota bacterium]
MENLPEAGEGKKVLKTLEIAEAVAGLNKNIRWLKKDPVVLTKNGKPVAALIAIKKYEKEYQTSK